MAKARVLGEETPAPSLFGRMRPRLGGGEGFSSVLRERLGLSVRSQLSRDQHSTARIESSRCAPGHMIRPDAGDFRRARVK